MFLPALNTRTDTFLEHLSLSYQLEVLCTQAVLLSREKWRNQLAVEMNRTTKTLSLRYWM